MLLAHRVGIVGFDGLDDIGYHWGQEKVKKQSQSFELTSCIYRKIWSLLKWLDQALSIQITKSLHKWIILPASYSEKALRESELAPCVSD